ncbi:MAG: NAD(P)H-hydrate dehydratase [Lentihominibacter sp.]
MDSMITISTEYVRDRITPRPVDMHKGQAGRVLVIAGSPGMAGAAVLALRGALYSGAGLVKALVPRELFNIIQISVPEAMCVDRDEFCKGSREEREKFFKEFDGVAIGPGIGVNRDNLELLEVLLQTCSCPVVIDADGLNCISRFGLPALHNGPAILTPHPGEADRLLAALGLGDIKVLSRKGAAEALAEKTGSVVLLKGAETVIADGHNDCDMYVNPTGNPGMATGGSGDVLTGIIVSLAAQKNLGLAPVEAACAGAFIHGLAGDIAAENVGEYGMTSADIADGISVALKELVGI